MWPKKIERSEDRWVPQDPYFGEYEQGTVVTNSKEVKCFLVMSDFVMVLMNYAIEYMRKYHQVTNVFLFFFP